MVLGALLSLAACTGLPAKPQVPLPAAGGNDGGNGGGGSMGM
jgi:hypothetical protein